MVEEVIEEFIEDIKLLEEIHGEELIEELNESSDFISENEKLFNFQCHLCEALTFPRFKHLESHTKNSHNCLPQVLCCSEKCGKVLSTWRRLMIHKEKHFPSTNGSIMRCEECFRIFTTKVGFEKHKKVRSIAFFSAFSY